MPDDPTQVVYVWWDALGNYITALDYGTDGEAFDTWWRASDERIHVIGKGIVRFHAVYWPAMLLSAGEPLPTKIFVHPYLTADGSKLSKTSGNSIDPVTVVDEVGTDALRWWLLRDVPRTVDADFTVERVIAAVRRGSRARRRQSRPSHRDDGAPTARWHPADRCADRRARVARRDRRRALRLRLPARVAVVRDLVDATNRRIDETHPWTLPGASVELDAALSELAAADLVGDLLVPFLPDTAGRVRAALTPDDEGCLPEPTPVVALLEPAPSLTVPYATGCRLPAGIDTTKRVPSASTGSTWASPPMAAASSCTIARPIPVPTIRPGTVRDV